MAIGADQIVKIIPGVIDAGGSALELNGLFLSKSVLLPSGSVTTWRSPESVANYFGATSPEALMANIYFLGYIGSQTKPSTMLIGQFVEAAVGGWVRGGEVLSTLADLQAITSGTLTQSIDGVSYSLTGIDFSSDLSFSAMATNLAAVFVAAGATGVTCVYSSDFKAFQIFSPKTGATSSVKFATAGTVGDALNLTAALGAVQSDGLDARTIAENMDAYTVITTNWVSFMHVFDQDDDEKIKFATWANGKNLGVRYVYSTWDSSVTATDPASLTCIGKRIKALSLVGTISNYNKKELAAFACAFIASLAYDVANGRATAAFKRQGGLVVTVDNAEDANALLENGYNFYGDYQTANDSFRWYYNGQISGDYGFIIKHVNAIQLNNAFQLAWMSLFGNVGSISYTLPGYDLLRAAGMDPINAALNFGTIRAGVPLSEAQRAQVDLEAGLKISGIIESRGWYLQILPATAQVRAAGGSPPMKFWYTDGGDVLKLEMLSNVIL